MMISPIVHRLLHRNDLSQLVAEVARRNPAGARFLKRALEAGKVDQVLDADEAVEAVRGNGGRPGALPLTLLWYVPVRAFLRQEGERDVVIADYTATIPLVFVGSRALRLVAGGEPGVVDWWNSIRSLPDGTLAQAERAAFCGALALWWAGCFPERVTRKGLGTGMLRAYSSFAREAFSLAARTAARLAPESSRLHRRAAERTDLIRAALADVRRDYLGSDAQTSDGRLERFLGRLGPLN